MVPISSECELGGADGPDMCREGLWREGKVEQERVDRGEVDQSCCE